MTKATPWRVGIIGLGGVGTKLLKVFSEHRKIEIGAVCDIAEQHVRDASDSLGGIPWFTDYRDLLQREELDFIYIGVPPKYHHQIVLDAVKMNKHIFCEKPLANSLVEAEEMSKAVQESKLVNGMNFPTYYRAAGTEFANLVRSGQIGVVRRLEVAMRFHIWPRDWQQNEWVGGREQGGFTREVVPHYLHMIESWFGQIIRLRSRLEFPVDPLKCETSLLAELRLADGTHVLLDGFSGIGQNEQINFTAYGTKGTLTLRNWTELLFAGIREDLHPIELDEWDHLAREVNEFIQALEGNSADIVDFRKGYRIQRILELLLESKDEWVDVKNDLAF